MQVLGPRPPGNPRARSHRRSYGGRGVSHHTDMLPDKTSTSVDTIRGHSSAVSTFITSGMNSAPRETCSTQIAHSQRLFCRSWVLALYVWVSKNVGCDVWCDDGVTELDERRAETWSHERWSASLKRWRMKNLSFRCWFRMAWLTAWGSLQNRVVKGNTGIISRPLWAMRGMLTHESGDTSGARGRQVPVYP
jgi:hypothetical protein